MIKLAHPMIEDDERHAVLAALDSGQLAQGPRVAALERDFAEYIGTRHAIAVNSGTAALHVALLAHGIEPPPIPHVAPTTNDQRLTPSVIVPAFSFAATANVVLLAGARPVFIDAREDDFGIDATAVEAAITPETRAVIATHLYGQVCDIERLRDICDRRKIALIEDAAQAVGATMNGKKAGSFGTGCFSFYATKNLQAGEGGMITTDDDAIAERARVFRSQGEPRRYVTELLGYNYRMTEIAAALGHAQLPKIDARNAARRANAARLTELLANNKRIVTPSALPDRRHVWHQYTVRVRVGRDARDQLQATMRERGIETGVFYPAPIPAQPLYQRLGYSDAHVPVAARLADEVLSLPVHPTLSTSEIESIATAVNELAV
jgi:dTDP-4-amino-4,6-dideoxygalactose transaminase